MSNHINIKDSSIDVSTINTDLCCLLILNSNVYFDRAIRFYHNSNICKLFDCNKFYCLILLLTLQPNVNLTCNFATDDVNNSIDILIIPIVTTDN